MMQIHDKLTLMAHAKPGAMVVAIKREFDTPVLVCDRHFAGWKFEGVRPTSDDKAYHLFNAGDEFPAAMYPRYDGMCNACYRAVVVTMPVSGVRNTFLFLGWADDRT